MSEPTRVRLAPWASLLAACRRLARWAWDNPSAEHEARGILSATKLGAWLGLEILLLCGGSFVCFTLLPQEASEFHEVIVEVGTGQFLISASLLTLSAFLTMIVPLRAVGLLEGPRWRGYMDQVVTTGISPARYFAGKWAVSQPFFLGLLLASLPLTVLFGMLGGVSPGRTVTAYLLLYAYCNLLLVATLALGVLLHEGLALALTWSLFLTLGIIDFTPIPSTLSAFTPVRYLIQPFVEVLAGVGAPQALELYGDPVVFGARPPWVVWALGLWGALGGFCVVTLCLGPLHRFLPGTNNFGVVVLPGDAKRLFFRRLRPVLTRRVELAFLFENRGPRLTRWTLPLRMLQVLGLFALFCVVVLNLVYHPTVISAVSDFLELLGVEAGALTLLMLGLVWTFSSGRSDVSLSFDLTPRLRVPGLWFDLGGFVIACALLVVVHSLTFAAAWPVMSLTPGLASYASIQSASEMLVRSAILLSVVLTTATIGLLVGKLAACRILSRDVVFMVSALYLIGLIVVPMFFLGAAEAVNRADDRALRVYARPLLALAQASPLMPMILAETDIPAQLGGGGSDHWLLRHAFWLWSGMQLVAFGLATLTSTLASYREARLLAGEARSSAPPCPGCGCELAAPLGWSWWGGALLPLALGYVRCIECGREFQRRTGVRGFGTVLMAFAARLLVSVVVVVGFLMWITSVLV